MAETPRSRQLLYRIYSGERIRRVAHMLACAGFVAWCSTPSVAAPPAEPSKAPIVAEAERLTQTLVTLSTRAQRPDATPEVLSKLVATAASRSALLAELIVEDPGQVLRLALPERVRARLPAAAQHSLEQRVELEGTLEALYEDYWDGEQLRGNLGYFLRADGEHYGLRFRAPPQALQTGAAVRVSGLLLPGTLEGDSSGTEGTMALDSAVTNLQFLAPDGTEQGGATSGGVIGEVVEPLGEQRTLVLLVSFQDTATETPFTLDEAHDAVFGTVNDFFYDASYKQTWLMGELDGGAPLKAIKVMKEPNPAGQGATWYYLESRQALGSDAFIAGNDNVLNGVLVHTGSDFDSSTSLLLDMTPNSSSLSFYDRNDPALTVGASFSDSASGLTISTDWTDAAGAGVSIVFEQPSCVRGEPMVALSPSQSQWVAPGTAVAYDVTVTSTDSDSCAAATFDLSMALPAADWTGGFNSNVLIVEPGGSGSTVLWVTSATTAADGFHDITMTAENDTDPTYAGLTTATYVVTAGAGNEAPVPMDDAATTAVDTPVSLAVLANDIDPDGDTLSVSEVTPGANGAVSINADGTLTYAPARRFKGTDMFTYRVTDGLGSATATATVTVRKGGGRSSGGGSGKGNGKNR